MNATDRIVTYRRALTWLWQEVFDPLVAGDLFDPTLENFETIDYELFFAVVLRNPAYRAELPPNRFRQTPIWELEFRLSAEQPSEPLLLCESGTNRHWRTFTGHADWTTFRAAFIEIADWNMYLPTTTFPFVVGTLTSLHTTDEVSPVGLLCQLPISDVVFLLSSPEQESKEPGSSDPVS